LLDQISVLYHSGVRRFIVSGTLGVGIWSGECVVEIKDKGFDVGLELLEPFPDHHAGWDNRSKRRLERIRKACCSHYPVLRQEAPDAMKRIRYKMIEKADIVIAIYDGDKNDRLMTQLINYAKKLGRQMILIHPDTAAVSPPLCPMDSEAR